MQDMGELLQDRRGEVKQGSKANTHIPVKVMRRQQLAQIQPRRLLQEFRLGSMRRIIAERHQHRSRHIDDLGIELENTRRRLDLRFEAMRGGAEPICQFVLILLAGQGKRKSSHHERSGQLEQELLSCKYSRNMLDDLASV